MNLLMALLFTRAVHARKVNPKRLSRSIRKETKFWVQFITELVQLINIIFNFIFIGINAIYHKCVSQKVVEEKLPENVILFDEYKLKKAK